MASKQWNQKLHWFGFHCINIKNMVVPFGALHNCDELYCWEPGFCMSNSFLDTLVVAWPKSRILGRMGYFHMICCFSIEAGYVNMPIYMICSFAFVQLFNIYCVYHTHPQDDCGKGGGLGRRQKMHTFTIKERALWCGLHEDRQVGLMLIYHKD